MSETRRAFRDGYEAGWNGAFEAIRSELEDARDALNTALEDKAAGVSPDGGNLRYAQECVRRALLVVKS